MPLDVTVLGEGIYTPREAARLIGSRPQDILRWTRGSGATSPLWQAHYQAIEDATEISFSDLVELRIVKALRRANISLQAIRFAISHAKKLFGVDHPLASLQFKTDGAEILIDAVEEDGELMSLSRRRPGQKVFAKIIDQSLNDLEFENGQAVLWRPYRWKAIVIDPKRLFGAPILEDYGVSTSTLYEEFQVFQDIGYLSKIYEIPKKSIQAAIFYERTLDEVMAQAAIESTP